MGLLGFGKIIIRVFITERFCIIGLELTVSSGVMSESPSLNRSELLVLQIGGSIVAAQGAEIST